MRRLLFGMDLVSLHGRSANVLSRFSTKETRGDVSPTLNHLPALLNDLATFAAPLKASIASLELIATVVCTLLALPPASDKFASPAMTIAIIELASNHCTASSCFDCVHPCVRQTDGTLVVLVGSPRF
jgi:hypothetical protein